MHVFEREGVGQIDAELRHVGGHLVGVCRRHGVRVRSSLRQLRHLCQLRLGVWHSAGQSHQDEGEKIASFHGQECVEMEKMRESAMKK